MVVFGWIASVLSIYGQENTTVATAIIKEGTVLHYRISIDDDAYPFVVKIVKLDFPNSIIFDYDMQSANRLQARIEMTSNALTTAQTLYNFFDGKDEVLNNSVSLFLSTKIITAIKNEKSSVNIPAHTALIKVDESDDAQIPFTKKGEKQIYKTNIANFSTQKISNDDVGYSIQYIDDKKCPLIVSMDIGWTVTLERIE